MASVQAPRRVSRYEIVREIGRGGSAIVYLARQSDLDRHVALKELAGFHAADPAFVQRFLHESRVAGSLSHPNIVTVYEYFEYEGTGFIAMEYFAEGSLRPRIGDLSPEQIAGVLEGLLGGLAYAEQRGIVHRDLKPENVMVTAVGDVKIADFGLAKASGAAEPGLTPSGSTVGTPAYMAPEQALGATVGPWTDLYSVGVIAYELLSGSVPFGPEDGAMATMLRHLNEDLPPLHAASGDLDPELAGWVEGLLAKSPENRPQDAMTALDDLDEILISVLGPRWRRKSRLRVSGSGGTTARPAETGVTETAPEPPRRTRRRLVPAVPVAAVLALGVAGVAAGLVLAGGSEREPTAPLASTEAERTTRRAQPFAGPVLARATVSQRSSAAFATLVTTGRPLKRGVLVLRDANLADGRAVLDLRQRGIETRTTGDALGSLSLRVGDRGDVVRVGVTARRGTFERVLARRAGEHRVVLELRRRVAPPPTEPTTPSSPPATTAEPPTSPKTTTPPKKDKPIIETG